MRKCECGEKRLGRIALINGAGNLFCPLCYGKIPQVEMEEVKEIKEVKEEMIWNTSFDCYD